MFTTSDPRKLIAYLQKTTLLRIYVNSDIISICTLRMFTILLKKKCIKYEIVFLSTNTRITKDEDYFIITNKIEDINDDKENAFVEDKRIYFGSEICSCTIHRLDILYNMFKLLKQNNCLEECSLWALIVPYTFYKIYPFQSATPFNGDSEEDDLEYNNNICKYCNDIYSEICIEIKNIEYYDNDGIFLDKDINLYLLKYSNLYLSLQNDIYFVTNNKLIYKKRKDLEEMKIKSFLAKKGVSLSKANEKYSNLDHESKRYMFNNLDIIKNFTRKKGHTYKMSSIDCCLLMSYYILRYKNLKAYLLLENIKDTIFNRVTNIHDIIFNIKDSIANASKMDDIIVYKLRPKNIVNLEYYIEFSDIFINIYKRKRYPDFLYIIIIDPYIDNQVLVFGRNVKIGNVLINGMKIFDRLTFYRSTFTNINCKK